MTSPWRPMLSTFAPTPAERKLRQRLVSAGPPPPRGAGGSVARLRVRVRDAGGIDCEGAKYPLTALRGMDASVWVTHHEAGSLQLTSRGVDTRAAGVLWARFYRGEELLITATGEDAERALETCRVLLEAAPDERRDLYRKHYRNRRSA